ncbi:MAG: hemerythrin domain-containing protein, partial [Magnetococcales bacterium]|nr:hemerythrin domain-containing protein [Magnetococcales bacterium]
KRPSETHKIIDILKRDHILIKKKMKALIDSNFMTMSWNHIYSDFKKLLVVHLDKEDRHLYPFLKIKATKNRELANVLNKFDSEISTISQLVRNLDEKINNGNHYVAEDFEHLYALLTFRMTLEEETIFKDFGNVIKTIENFEVFKSTSITKLRTFHSCRSSYLQEQRFIYGC